MIKPYNDNYTYNENRPVAITAQFAVARADHLRRYMPKIDAPNVATFVIEALSFDCQVYKYGRFDVRTCAVKEEFIVTLDQERNRTALKSVTVSFAVEAQAMLLTALSINDGVKGWVESALDRYCRFLDRRDRRRFQTVQGGHRLRL